MWLGSEGTTGLAEVKIMRSHSSYPGTAVCTTDYAGYHESDLGPIPGDEMITVWAELDGYTFDPPSHRWRHYAGVESRTLSFVASSTASGH